MWYNTYFIRQMLMNKVVFPFVDFFCLYNIHVLLITHLCWLNVFFNAHKQKTVCPPKNLNAP